MVRWILWSIPALAAAPATDVARARMVDRDLRQRDITDEHVLRAMGTVPRHEFVPADQRPYAYEDRPLPIGHDQTISQPYVVARMTQLADVDPGEKALEVGTGSGYQAAVLAEVGAEVYTIEIVAPLAEEARRTLERTGYARVRTRTGDGYQGWPEEAPFDAILVTAAPDHVPDPLLRQLVVGGHLVLPVGPAGGVQELVRITRTPTGYERQPGIPVRFVPMTGEAAR